MPAIRKILCPVDFSEPSDNALEHAAALARSVAAELEIVHVYQIPVYDLPGAPPIMLMPDVIESLRTDFNAALTEQAAKVTGVSKVTTHLIEGIAYHEIVTRADEIGADLIVMGTHGRTGLAHLVMGSVAERVVRSARVPVMTVPMQSK